MSTKLNLLELLRLPSEEILTDTDQGSVYAYYPLPDGVTPDPTALYAPSRDGLKRYEGNLSDLPNLSTDCNIGPPEPNPVAPIWNNTLELPAYTPGQVYEQQIPLSALTPASGQSIVGIAALYLPAYLSIQPGGADYVLLRGTIPGGSGTAAFSLRGVQSDGLYADKSFFVGPIAVVVSPPTWNGSLSPKGFVAGSFYIQELPLTALTATGGQEIVDIDSISLPGYMQIQGADNASKILVGQIPPGTPSISITLFGKQTDGQTAKKTFTLTPGIAPPMWNGSITYKKFVPGQYFEAKLFYSALTPAPGQTITGITGVTLPSYLSIQPGGSGYVLLAGTVPAGTLGFSFELQGIQSDAQTANASFFNLAEPQPPVWNNSLSLSEFTPGQPFEKKILFSSLTPASGETITDIREAGLQSYLTIQPGGAGYVWLRGTIPSNYLTSLQVALTGYQSNGLTAAKAFYLLPPASSTQPPIWNGTFTPSKFTAGQSYQQSVPFSALNTATGQSIISITGALPSYLTIEPGGNGAYSLRGTIPTGITSVNFTLYGQQTDGQTASQPFTIYANDPIPIAPPTWNNTLTFGKYTGGQVYEQQIPFSALTPASGQSIVGIAALYLPAYLSIQPGGSSYVYLRGTIPAGSGSMSFQLRGVQSDNQVAEKIFTIGEIPPPQAIPPVWNNSLVLAKYTPGQYYEQQVPLSSVDPASGKTINNIVAVNLPGYLTFESGGFSFKYLRGTIPAGVTLITIQLQGVQSDGLTANKSFTLSPAPQPPVWNGSLSLANFTTDQLYEQALPFSALTPGIGQTITSISAPGIHSFLSIQSGGAGYVYLRGTIPAGYGSLSFTLRGTQTGGLSADQLVTISAGTQAYPPVWNNSLVFTGFTSGAAYEQALPFTSLTPASGTAIVDISGVNLPGYLSIQTTSGVRYLRGTVPFGTTSISVTLRGLQSDGLTADKAFVISPLPAQVAPTWNSSFVPPKFTPGQNYYQNVPLSALTPASGRSITSIAVVSLPGYLSLQTQSSPGQATFYVLVGVIPSGTPSPVSFILQGVQSDGLTANKTFSIDSLVSYPPVWNNTLTFPAYTVGQFYERQLPFSALTPASGQTITDIIGGLPSYLSIQVSGGVRYLRGTIPGGMGSVSFTLKGIQSDGLSAEKTFAIAPVAVPTPPAWNNSLTLPGFTPGAYYNQKLPFSALTPGTGRTIADIVPVALQPFLTIQTDGNNTYRYLRGTIPGGYGSVSFDLQGVQDDGLTANRSFTIYPVSTQPPIWNNSLNLSSYTAGQAYEQQIPLSSLTPASGQSISDIIAPALQSFLSIQPGGSAYVWLRGTIPAGYGNLSFTLRGVQSDSLTADRIFTIYPAVVAGPPIWNGSLVLANYYTGRAYEQQLPLSALTPANGQSITNITGINLPYYLSIQVTNGVRYLRGTVPAGTTRVGFTLKGAQSDGQTANYSFEITAIPAEPPVWNGTLTTARYTAGQPYEQALPLSALTPASGQTITDIIGASLPNYLSIQTTSGTRYLRGTIPGGYSSISFVLRGVQSDSLTADQTFTIYPAEAIPSNPPVWNNTLTFQNFTAGQFYERQIPFSSLNAGSGQTITDIVAVSIPSFLSIQPGGSNYKILRGTVPVSGGYTNVPFTLRGVQSDGLSANRTFTIYPVLVSTPPPTWNNSFVPAGFTPGLYYNQQVPYSALTPAQGQGISDITPKSLPAYLTLQSNNGVKYLRGTPPAGTTSVTLSLTGLQSDGQMADKSFTLSAVSANPPTWNNSLVFGTFTPGQYYEVQLPPSALNPASGQQIIEIGSVSVPSYLSVQVSNNYRVIRGTIPSGTSSLSITLYGKQTDGQTANKTFTLQAAAQPIAAPVWNGSLVFTNYPGGQAYQQALPLSALTPASGQSITDITGVNLPSFLSIQTTSGVRYLRGTIPAEYAAVEFVLKGIQSDGQFANRTVAIYRAAAGNPPVWNGSLVLPKFTAGQFYEVQLPLSALTSAPGQTITDIVAQSIQSFLTVQTSNGVRYLRGTIPAGTTTLNFDLKGVQSDGQTAINTFFISAVAVGPPVWNNNLNFPNYAAGQFYEQALPFSSLTPASGQSITDIYGASLPSFLYIQDGGNGLKYLRGTVPTSGGYTSINITLYGQQTDGQTAQKSFTLTAAQNVNRAPILVNPIRSAVVASYNTPFSYTWQASDFSDPDPGDTLTWSMQYSADGGATFGALPSWAQFNPTTRTFSGTSITAGLTYFRRTVTDPGGLSKSEVFTLSTAAQQANRPPVVSNPNQFLFAQQGTAFSFPMPQNTFSDPDGDTLTYSLQYSSDGGSTYGALPGWTSYNASTRTWTGTPPVTSGSGVTYKFRVTANDGRGGTASDPFNLICNPQN